MNGQRTSLEIIAPSVEDAVAKGLADLGLPENAVEVEILDDGSRGIFGIGSRQARVRLTIKGEEIDADQPVQFSDVSEEQPEPNEGSSVSGVDNDLDSEPASERVIKDDDIALEIVIEIVQDLLERMKVSAEVEARFGEPDDARSRVPLLVDIHGDDLSILIGPKAETLNAFQYIVNLIVGKELGRSIPLVLDVEGYRQRREQQLRQLARRMAEQAVKAGRRQTLEPMPPNERRLIHIELRDHPDVYTESFGENPRRKVTIVPKFE